MPMHPAADWASEDRAPAIPEFQRARARMRATANALNAGRIDLVGFGFERD